MCTTGLAGFTAATSLFGRFAAGLRCVPVQKVTPYITYLRHAQEGGLMQLFVVGNFITEDTCGNVSEIFLHLIAVDVGQHILRGDWLTLILCKLRLLGRK